MSVQQERELDRKMRTVDAQDGQLFADDLGLDQRYDVVTMDPVQGYGPIVAAWATMKYPLNVDEDGQHGVIQGKGMRHAKQRPDGSGIYESVAGGTLYAIRTTDGTIIWNDHADSDHWPYTTRDVRDDLDPDEISFPFGFVGVLVTEQTDADLHHPDSILAMGRDGNTVDGDEFMRGVVRADVHEGEERGVLLEHKDGIQVYVGYDSTAHGEGTFGFVPFDGEDGVRAPTARDALDLLRPDGALGDEPRQGEWFLVPQPEGADEAQGTIQKPGVSELPYGASPLNGHVPRDWKTAVPDLEFVRRVVYDLVGDQAASTSELAGVGISWQDSPQEIIEKIDTGRIDMTFERARELAGGVYVRGSIRHRRQEHQMETLDEWHQAVTHDHDVISIDDATALTGRRYHVD